MHDLPQAVLPLAFSGLIRILQWHSSGYGSARSRTKTFCTIWTFVMNSTTLSAPNSTTAPEIWNEFADRVLAGGTLTADEALAVLESPDDELMDLLAAA